MIKILRWQYGGGITGQILGRDSKQTKQKVVGLHKDGQEESANGMEDGKCWGWMVFGEVKTRGRRKGARLKLDEIWDGNRVWKLFKKQDRGQDPVRSGRAFFHQTSCIRSRKGD